MSKRTNGRPTPRPFLKWAGGKRGLMSQIMHRLPDGPIDLYVEPFLGGGAVFLELARQGRIRRAVLGDRNPELAHTWMVVQEDPEGLIAALEQWPVDAETYSYVRDELDPLQLSDTDRAARVLWLNRTCFNGLYRKNRKGRFNVPFGKPRSVNFDPENIRAVSRALVGVSIANADFGELVAEAGADAVVYADPPYLPVSKTSSFSCYDGCPFGPPEHARLVADIAAARDRGAFGLLSNSWTPAAVELCQRSGLHVDRVLCGRAINRSGKKRGAVPELMATTAPWLDTATRAA